MTRWQALGCAIVVVTGSITAIVLVYASINVIGTLQRLFEAVQ